MLYLIRHGQTEFNWAGRLQGHTDSPLTERGIAQAHRVGRKLNALIGVSPVTVWVSPLGRARETAAIICEHIEAADVKPDRRIAEIGLGDWEGLTFEDIEFTHPGALDGSSAFDWAYRAPGGEPEAAFYQRLESWLNEVKQANTPSIAVSHGWTGMGLRSLYTGLSFPDVSAKGDSHEAVFHFAKGEVKEH